MASSSRLALSLKPNVKYLVPYLCQGQRGRLLLPNIAEVQGGKPCVSRRAGRGKIDYPGGGREKHAYFERDPRTKVRAAEVLNLNRWLRSRMRMQRRDEGLWN